MKDKYEHEIRELENAEKGLKDKYIEARTRLAEGDANNQNLKAMVTQMELQLSHSTKVRDSFADFRFHALFDANFFALCIRKVAIS